MSRVGERIEIGAVRQDEVEAMLAVLCQAFDLPLEAARPIFYRDPYFDLANKRVLRVDGEIVSCLTIAEAACYLGTGIVPLAGIAGVSTLPSARRHGYAGRLLASTVDELIGRGYALAALFPFSYDYYRKFGFEQCGEARCLRFPPERLPRFAEAMCVREAREEDIPELMRLYDSSSAGRTLYCLRDRKRWSYTLANARFSRVYQEASQPPAGYLLYEHRAAPLDAAMELVGGSPLPQFLRVLEACASTPSARRGLTGYLAGQSDVRYVEHEAATGPAPENALFDLFSSILGELLKQAKTVPTIMVRILDLAACLRALSSSWPELRGGLALKMRDPVHPGGVATVDIVGAGRDRLARITRPGAGPVGGMGTIEGDVQAWSQVITGHISLAEACSLGRLKPSDRHVVALASDLFPRRYPYLPATDHF